MTHEYDYSILRGAIKTKFKNEGNFSKAMGFTSQNSLSDRFSGKVPWRQSEMLKTCELLQEPLDMVKPYFFTYKVRKKELS